MGSDLANAVLDNALASSLASGDIDSMIGVINNVAASLSTVNCTLAPNCTYLNRYECQSKPHTCGYCKEGYLGVVGESNGICFKVSERRRMEEVKGDWRRLHFAVHQRFNVDKSVGGIGDQCNVDTDCFFNWCDLDTGFCGAPTKVCPTTEPGLECSGQGACIGVDSSLVPIDECLVYDTKCTVQCVCDDGFG